MVSNPEDDLKLERQADYRVLSLSGNHYDIGRQWAEITTGKAVASITEQEAAEAAELLGVSVEQLAALDIEEEENEESQAWAEDSFALDCLQVVYNFHPPLLDEFEGWADALGAETDSILAALGFGTDPRKAQCSAFAWRTGQRLIVGRNYDFFQWVRARYLVRAEPVAYYSTVGTSDGLLGGRHEGVNEHGLFVALNEVSALEPKKPEPGVVSHLVPRILLETCVNAGEAVMLATEMPHLMGCSYLIADPAEMFVVEAYPGTVRLREADDGYIAVTNHFLHQDLKDVMLPPTPGDSEKRLYRIESTLRGAAGQGDGWAAALDILMDHETPVCRHGDGPATLWSMVADLSKHRLAYSLGAPCRNEYREIPWPGKAHPGGNTHQR